MMDLETFISQSLSQILNGIDLARQIKRQSAICPLGTSGYSGTDLITNIDFEVIVSIEDNTKATAGAKINVLPIRFGSDIEGESKNSQVNKIKFSVPITYAKITYSKG